MAANEPSKGSKHKSTESKPAPVPDSSLENEAQIESSKLEYRTLSAKTDQILLDSLKSLSEAEKDIILNRLTGAAQCIHTGRNSAVRALGFRSSRLFEASPSHKGSEDSVLTDGIRSWTDRECKIIFAAIKNAAKEKDLSFFKQRNLETARKIMRKAAEKIFLNEKGQVRQEYIDALGYLNDSGKFVSHEVVMIDLFSDIKKYNPRTEREELFNPGEGLKHCLITSYVSIAEHYMGYCLGKQLYPEGNEVDCPQESPLESTSETGSLQESEASTPQVNSAQESVEVSYYLEAWQCPGANDDMQRHLFPSEENGSDTKPQPKKKSRLGARSASAGLSEWIGRSVSYPEFPLSTSITPLPRRKLRPSSATEVERFEEVEKRKGSTDPKLSDGIVTAIVVADDVPKSKVVAENSENKENVARNEKKEKLEAASTPKSEEGNSIAVKGNVKEQGSTRKRSRKRRNLNKVDDSQKDAKDNTAVSENAVPSSQPKVVARNSERSKAASKINVDIRPYVEGPKVWVFIIRQNLISLENTYGVKISADKDIVSFLNILSEGITKNGLQNFDIVTLRKIKQNLNFLLSEHEKCEKDDEIKKQELVQANIENLEKLNAYIEGILFNKIAQAYGPIQEVAFKLLEEKTISEDIFIETAEFLEKYPHYFNLVAKAFKLLKEGNISPDTFIKTVECLKKYVLDLSLGEIASQILFKDALGRFEEVDNLREQGPEPLTESENKKLAAIKKTTAKLKRPLYDVTPEKRQRLSLQLCHDALWIDDEFLHKELFFDIAMDHLEFRYATKELKKTHEYQYLQNVKELRRRASDPLSSEEVKDFCTVVQRFESIVQNSDFSKEEKAEAYEVANIQINKVLSPQASINENEDAFDRNCKQLSRQITANKKTSSIFGGFIGGIGISAGVGSILWGVAGIVASTTSIFATFGLSAPIALLGIGWSIGAIIAGVGMIVGSTVGEKVVTQQYGEAREEEEKWNTVCKELKSTADAVLQSVANIAVDDGHPSPVDMHISVDVEEAIKAGKREANSKIRKKDELDTEQSDEEESSDKFDVNKTTERELEKLEKVEESPEKEQEASLQKDKEVKHEVVKVRENLQAERNVLSSPKEAEKVEGVSANVPEQPLEVSEKSDSSSSSSAQDNLEKVYVAKAREYIAKAIENYDPSSHKKSKRLLSDPGMPIDGFSEKLHYRAKVDCENIYSAALSSCKEFEKREKKTPLSLDELLKCHKELFEEIYHYIFNEKGEYTEVFNGQFGPDKLSIDEFLKKCGQSKEVLFEQYVLLYHHVVGQQLQHRFVQFKDEISDLGRDEDMMPFEYCQVHAHFFGVDQNNLNGEACRIFFQRKRFTQINRAKYLSSLDFMELFELKKEIDAWSNLSIVERATLVSNIRAEILVKIDKISSEEDVNKYLNYIHENYSEPYNQWKRREKQAENSNDSDPESEGSVPSSPEQRVGELVESSDGSDSDRSSRHSSPVPQELESSPEQSPNVSPVLGPSPDPVSDLSSLEVQALRSQVAFVAHCGLNSKGVKGDPMPTNDASIGLSTELN